MLVDLVIFVLGWSAGWWLLWRVPVPPGEQAGAGRPAGWERPGLSIVIPARNEELALPILLKSLRPQLEAHDQMIVVDDHSQDRTAEVAHRGGAVVLEAPPLPLGWQGKAWACAVGARAATQGRLLFLDADTRLWPGGLTRIRDDAARKGGLYSVQPWHDVPRPHERLAALFNLVAMMGTGAFTPRRAPRTIGAFGPCLVTSAADYHRVGGHGGVRHAVLDDAALAATYRRAGLPVTIRGGRGSVAFRMYPGGPCPLVEGFTKNMASGARTTRPLTLALVVAWLTSLSAPLVLVADTPVLAAVCYLAVVVQLVILLGRIGSFGPITAGLYLAPLAVFITVFGLSVVATFVRRRVRWKGRELTVGPPR